MKIVSVEQMIQIEKAADAAGHSYAQMMERAGQSVAEALLARIPDIAEKQVLVLTGSGNNGGDGLVAARWLADAGASVVVYLTKERSDGDPHLTALKARDILVVIADQDQRNRVLTLQLGSTDILIDAVLGTGIQLPLRGSAKKVLQLAKKSADGLYVLAVDCPSGLDSDTGEVADESMEADLTVTLAAAKPGLFQFPGAAYVGELVIGDIGLPSKMEQLDLVGSEVATTEHVQALAPARPLDAHKGTFGRALIVAGSMNYPGAAALAGRAAYLAGAGLVTMAVPSSVQMMIAAGIPECTWLPLETELDDEAANALSGEWESTEALLIGPGFGLEPATMAFMNALVEVSDELPALVVDADGLKLLARIEGWASRLPEASILTPHPGEMSVLSGIATSDIQANRSQIACEKADEWGHIVVLKGAYTVIAHPDGRSTLIPIATPALSHAGTGDVLAGLMAGYLAQGVAAYEAAILSTFVHARAGLLAAETIGTTTSVLASDVADAVPWAIAELETLH